MSSAKKNPIQTLRGSAGLIRAREIISGQYDEYKSVRFSEPHRRNFYSFFLVKQGYIKHSIDFTSYTCSKGQVFFMAPHQVYLIDSADNFGGISISFQPEILDIQELNLPVIRNILNNNLIAPDEEILAELLGLGERMVLLFRDELPFSNDLMRSCLRTFLLYLSRSWVSENPMLNKSPEDITLVEKFRALINQHWKEFIQVAEYASQLHISQSHLNALVKRECGKECH